MNNTNLIIIIIFFVLLLLIINNKSENFIQTQCQRKVYIDPHNMNHCNLECCNPYGNRYLDNFSVFFPS